MTAIAGIARPDKEQEVHRMLNIMKHRGPVGEEVLDIQGVTFGANWTASQTTTRDMLRQDHLAADCAGRSRFAQAAPESAGFVLKRDPVGIAPLYFGRMADGTLCFASEAKALLGMAENIQELSPGCILEKGVVKPYSQVKRKAVISASPAEMARQVHDLLLNAVQVCIHSDTMGSWLSGGLDSSAIASLARPYLKHLHTFSIGLAGSPDLEHARIVARHIQSEHHERVVEPEELLHILPAVIENLESFDALLVRSSVINYLVSQMTVGFVEEVFSG
ncbi:MAG: asparagine synthase-related protein, partial [Anaerolineaceae bacterium]